MEHKITHVDISDNSKVTLTVEWPKPANDTDDLQFPAHLKREYVKGAELPAWVLRKGAQNAPRVWAPIKHYVPAASDTTTVETVVAAVKRNAAPKAPKVVAGAQGVGRAGTAAEQVRGYIREAMAAGRTIDTVIAKVKESMGFSDAKANRYVTENWAKLEKKGKA